MSMRIKRMVVLWILGFALLPAVVPAQGAKWEPIGPEGGYIASVVRDLKNPEVLYTITYGKPARFFASKDQGITWTERGTMNERISKLLVNPLKPGSLYALSSGFSQDPSDSSESLRIDPSQLYETMDEGKNWNARPFPPIYSVLGVVFDPKDPQTIHAIARTSIGEGVAYLKSSDGGEFWNATELPGRNVYSGWIGVDPVETKNVYVTLMPTMFTLDTKVLFKSSDGGMSFAPLTVSKNQIGALNDLGIDPVFSGRIFALNYSGVYRSSDGGRTWEKNKGALPYAQKIWIDVRDSSHLVIAVDKGVAESRDGGMTWKVAEGKVPGSGITALLVDTRKPGGILLANSAGVFGSSDGGASWKPRNRGMCAASVTSLRVDPSSPNTLYAGLMSNAVYKTGKATAETVSWEQLPVFYTCTSIGDIQILPKKPFRVIALEGGG